MRSTQSAGPIKSHTLVPLPVHEPLAVTALQARFNATSAVSIDTEMANLLTLQNSYAANARVMSTVKAMLDSLMQVPT